MKKYILLILIFSLLCAGCGAPEEAVVAEMSIAQTLPEFPLPEGLAWSRISDTREDIVKDGTAVGGILLLTGEPIPAAPREDMGPVTDLILEMLDSVGISDPVYMVGATPYGPWALNAIHEWTQYMAYLVGTQAPQYLLWVNRAQLSYPEEASIVLTLSGAQQEPFSGSTWQEAYEKVLFSDPARYLALRDSFEPLTDRWMHLGIHDFDGDSVPELVIGDGYSLAVFTYQDSKAQKIADLYIPGIEWCVNGVSLRGNGLSVQCAGARVVNYVNFGWVDGEYQLGYYTEQCPEFDPPQINGHEATLADMDRIYPISNYQFYPEDIQYRFQMTQEGDTWVIRILFPAEQILTVQRPFDWDSFWWN